MDDLIAFLRARLDEHEQSAQATTSDSWTTKVASGHAYVIRKGAANLSAVAEVGDMANGWHIARHDPQFVLADVEAKRRIIADCERAITRAKASKHGDDYERWPPWSKLAYRTVWNLAQPFAGHPDYRESPFAASVIAFMTWLESESGGRDTP